MSNTNFVYHFERQTTPTKDSSLMPEFKRPKDQTSKKLFRKAFLTKQIRNLQLEIDHHHTIMSPHKG